MQKYNSRADVPEKYKWDLTDICADQNEFDDKYKELVKMIDNLATYKGCTKDSNKLLEFLNLDNKTMALLERLFIYAYVNIFLIF